MYSCFFLLDVREIIVAQKQHDSHEQDHKQKPVHVARAVCVRRQEGGAHGLRRIANHALLDARKAILQKLDGTVNVAIARCPLRVSLWTRIVRCWNNSGALCCFVALQSCKVIGGSCWTRHCRDAHIGVVGRTCASCGAGPSAQICDKSHPAGAGWSGTHLFTQ
jgi:hypothetical protein